MTSEERLQRIREAKNGMATAIEVFKECGLDNREVLETFAAFLVARGIAKDFQPQTSLDGKRSAISLFWRL